MRKSPPKPELVRRERAKDTIDFATGEVHDPLVDAAAEPALLAPEPLSDEERARLRIGPAGAAPRRRAKKMSARRG